VTASPAQALATGRGSATALAWPGGQLDYETLSGMLAGLAGRLRSAAADPRPVAVVSRSRVRTAIGVLAADWAGRPALPLDPARPGLGDCLERANPGVVLADPDIDLPGERPRLSFEATGPALPPAGGEGPALIVPTSGTSGPPRLAVLGRPALAAQAAASARVLPALEPGTGWLSCLPMTSIGGLAALWRALGAGAGLWLVERFEPPVVASLMDGTVTHVSIVPAMLPALMGEIGRPPARLACALTGGGPLSGDLARQALDAGWPLWTGWGMTETASHVAAGPVDSAWEEGIAGRALPGISITADPSTGRLRVAGPTLMDGYLEPAGAAGLEADGSLLTADSGRVEPGGRIRILGRADEVIVTGGVNVHPEAVEAALAGCPDIGDVGVTGVADPRWGRCVVAVYTGNGAPDALAAWAKDHWAARGLGPAWRPRCWCRVAALPRNALGKIDRRALADLAARSGA